MGRIALLLPVLLAGLGACSADPASGTPPAPATAPARPASDPLQRAFERATRAAPG